MQLLEAEAQARTTGGYSSTGDNYYMYSSS